VIEADLERHRWPRAPSVIVVRSLALAGQVAATEVGTGRAASVTIEAASGLSSDEVLRLGEQIR